MKATYLCILGLFSTLFFNNCNTPVGFSEIASSDNNDSILTDGSVVTEIKYTPFKTQYEKTDILFVIDESCSMNDISQSVQLGIASISSVDYISDTQMAVTHMAPARVNADGVISFDTAFAKIKNFEEFDLIENSAGFIKLLNAESVSQYKKYLEQDGLNGKVKDNYKKALCNEDWYSPQQLNSNSEKCIEVAMQSPLLCTGSEAGKISVFQLMRKHVQLKKKIFRDGSLVQIIFISDTHDPGANYYGKPNAYSSAPTYEQLRDSIYAANSNIKGLKFNGIVPLPMLGSELLDGLNVIGSIPTSEADYPFNEETNSFSYLEPIKKSKGFAIHAAQNDWSPILKSLINQSVVNRQLTVDTGFEAEKIIEVRLNDLLVPEEKIEFIPPSKIIIKLDDGLNDQNIKVELKYEKKEEL